jgi:hypothetical protein
MKIKKGMRFLDLEQPKDIFLIKGKHDRGWIVDVEGEPTFKGIVINDWEMQEYITDTVKGLRLLPDFSDYARELNNKK